MALVSQAEFARSLGVDRAYVTQLKQAGRLVMRGTKVDAEASVALIERTSGSRNDVARRHQVARQDRDAALATETAGDEPAAAAAVPDVSSVAVNAMREGKASAESRLALANARLREVELEERLGNLVPKAEVEFVLQDLGATLRAQLDGIADRLAPVLLPMQTLEEVHSALTEEAESIGRAVSDQMRRNAERAA